MLDMLVVEYCTYALHASISMFVKITNKNTLNENF